jgi:pimeloyl-ACP methyl ester carboxylesterase
MKTIGYASLSSSRTAEAPARRPRTAGGRREGARGLASARLDAWRGELSALSRMALSFLSHTQLPHDAFDPGVRHPTPLVLVHGIFGSAANFLSLRQFLSTRGLGNFATFSYPPRLDHQRLAVLLGRRIAAVCRATGSPHVDVVGHSFGGLVARYLVEMQDGGPVRRLITLGSPYFSNRLAAQELAIFGANDPLVTPPDPAHGPRGRVLLVLRCGHLGLLCHRAVLGAVFGFLSGPTTEASLRGSVRENDPTVQRPALRVAGATSND